MKSTNQTRFLSVRSRLRKAVATLHRLPGTEELRSVGKPVFNCTVDAMLSRLSQRERQILIAFAHDPNDKAVASRFGTKVQTIRNQLRSVRTKLGVHTREELVIRFIVAWYTENRNYG